MELGLGSTWDGAHYIVVSSIRGEAVCTVTAICPCYNRQDQSAMIEVGKSGDITNEQLKSPMLLFSHGGVTNPHVMGRYSLHILHQSC